MNYSLLPYDVINKIVENTSMLQNSKYIMSITNQGKTQYKFNYENKGYKHLSELYKHRCNTKKTFKVFMHTTMGSMPFQASEMNILSYVNGRATILMELSLISDDKHWLLLDMEIKENPDMSLQDQIVERLRRYIPTQGMFIHYDWFKQTYTNYKVAMVMFKQYGENDTWLDIKCVSPYGFWGYDANGLMDYYMDLIDDEVATEIDELPEEQEPEWDEPDLNNEWTPLEQHVVAALGAQ
jgi:hypothetical protein